MRYLVHLGLFLGAFAAVTSAEAQPNRRADRDVTLVVAGHGHPNYHNSKHVKYDKHDKYDKHHGDKHAYRVPPGRAYGHHNSKAKYRLHDERRDLRQIVDISRAWRRAMITRDYYGRAMADQRLDAWIERELYEARRDHHRGHHYTRQIRDLSRQLDELSWRFATGHAGRHDYARKTAILDRLVGLSERQVYQARFYSRPPTRLSYADDDYRDHYDD